MAEPVAKPDVLVIGPAKPLLAKGLAPAYTVHSLIEAPDREALISTLADKVRAFAVTYSNQKINAEFMQRFPKLATISSLGKRCMNSALIFWFE